MAGEQSTPSNETVEAAYNQYLMPIWKSLDIPIRSASGTTLEDFDGNEYLDLFSGISVTNVGHTDELVVDAAKEQLEEFVHGCSYVHPNQPVAELAKRIAEITPGELQKSFFGNSGTEAVEGAIKLARKHTGAKEIVAIEMAFHGRTLGSLSLTGNHAYKQGMAPTINDVTHAPAPYQYRSPYGDLPEPEFAEKAANELERVVGTQTSTDIAAIVIEPVMGEGGIIVPPDRYLERVQEIAHNHGALFIIDEVQTGYGRTGRMFATDHFDVQPDIMPQAKGIANGLPLGAFTAPSDIADSFDSGDHLSTFGGNPVAAAGALASIDRLMDGVVDNSAELGSWLNDRLTSLEADLPVVGETRGLGLMWGIELVDPDEEGPSGVAPAPDKNLAKDVGDHLCERGIVLGVGGYYNNVLRLQPPLTITREQLGQAIDEIETALKVKQ